MYPDINKSWRNSSSNFSLRDYKSSRLLLLAVSISIITMIITRRVGAGLW